MIKGSRCKPVQSVIPTGCDPLPDESVLKSLKEVCPNAVFFTTIPSLDPEETDSASEQGEHQEILQPLRDLHHHYDNDVNEGQLAEIWREYKCTESQANDLELQTRGQTICPTWYEQRKGRITASKAHDILVRRQTTKPDNLVRLITGSKTYDLTEKKAVK